MAAPEGTTMDNAIDATTGVVGGAYATYKELYTTKDYPAEGIRVDTLVDTFGLKGENPKTSDFSTDEEHCDTYPPLAKTPQSFARQLYKQPVRYCDIFVDDYIGIGQDHPMNPIDNQRRTIMHKIDGVFQQSDAATDRIARSQFQSRNYSRGMPQLTPRSGSWGGI